jgi:hypothetical protein
MSSSIIEDFSHIHAELKKIEEEKEKQKSADRDKPMDWTSVENVYGYPNNAPCDLTAVRENIWGIAFCKGGSTTESAEDEYTRMTNYLERELERATLRDMEVEFEKCLADISR